MAENVDYASPDKVLFAQTLVNFIFRGHDDVYLQYIPYNKEDNVHYAFTAAVRDAVELIEEMLEAEVKSIFRRILENNNRYEEAFSQHASELRQKCFSEGFDAKNFIHYCVHISMLAENFYPNQLHEAPDLALTCIANCIRDLDMFSGGWETLEMTAKRYQNQSLNMPTPSPSTSETFDDFAIAEDAELAWLNTSRISPDNEETDEEEPRSGDSQEEQKNEDVQNQQMEMEL